MLTQNEISSKLARSYLKKTKPGTKDHAKIDAELDKGIRGEKPDPKIVNKAFMRAFGKMNAKGRTGLAGWYLRNSLKKESIKAMLSELALDEILKVRAVRKGKLKRVRRSANVAQANNITHTTPQQRRKSTRQRLRTVKKKGGIKAKQIRKQKRSSRISRRAGIGV